MGKKQKRAADADMSQEEQDLMRFMPTVCGMQLVDKLCVGTEMKRVSGAANKRIVTVKAKICCAGCKGGWTPCVRMCDKLPTKEDVATSLAAKIAEAHEGHHSAAVGAAYGTIEASPPAEVSAPVAAVAHAKGDGMEVSAANTSNDSKSLVLAEAHLESEARSELESCDACCVCPRHRGMDTQQVARKQTPVDKRDLKDWTNPNEEHRAKFDPRKGVVGWMHYWACGSVLRVVLLIISLASHFDVSGMVLEKLLEGDSPQAKKIRVDGYICDRLAGGIEMLKGCQSERQREEFYTVLGAVAAEPAKVRDAFGMGHQVTTRLKVNQSGLPWRRSVAARALADAAFPKFCDPLQAGDKAIAHGRPCTVEVIRPDKSCALTFESAEGVKALREFSSLGKGRGGARLSRPPISFRPDPRAKRKDAKADAAEPFVKQLFDEEGARSPSMRDEVKKRVGVGLYMTAQAVLIYSTYAALYALFQQRFPAIAISFALFKKLRPWYVRHVKRQTCLCQCCTNFKYYQEALQSLPILFEDIMHPPTADEESSGADASTSTSDSSQGSAAMGASSAAADEWSTEPLMIQLMSFCECKFKSDMVKKVLQPCLGDGDMLDGSLRCISQGCSDCGFQRLWSKGLRKKVVDAHGNIRANAPVEFQSEMKWTKVGAPKEGEHREEMHDQRGGTVVEFLDEFESNVMCHFPHHKYTLLKQKASAAQFDRNRGPGFTKSDVDFAENGLIITAESVQSEYWLQRTYTLFVQVQIAPTSVLGLNILLAGDLIPVGG